VPSTAVFAGCLRLAIVQNEGQASGGSHFAG